jgi:hypothetical protein
MPKVHLVETMKAMIGDNVAKDWIRGTKTWIVTESIPGLSVADVFKIILHCCAEPLRGRSR